MAYPYIHRWRAHCADCAWYTTAYDRHVADGAVRVHGQLKPGHHATVDPIEPEEE